MNQIDKNTVKAINQTKKSVRYPHTDKGGVKILFVGNSITFHGIREDTGWFHEWGMAASSENNDYVHRIIEKLGKDNIKSDICLALVADWECKYKEETDYDEINARYKDAQDFVADIIVMRAIENCSARNDFQLDKFINTYEKMVEYFKKSEKAKVIITSSFWKHPGDESIKKLCEEKYGGHFVYLGDLGELDEMKALGKYEDSGIQNHPGDKGMEAIAQRIYTALKEIINN